MKLLSRPLLASSRQTTLSGITIVITGASSGIGRATVLALAEEGATLVLAARRESVLAEVAAACQQRGANAIFVKTDVTDAEAMRELAQAAADFSGGIDVWINNAGIGAVGEFTQTPIEAHEQVIRTNLLGYMNGAHAVLPYFKRQGYGNLINVISFGAWVPQAYTVAYSASKFGLRGFSQALRGELLRWPNIRLCDVFPAFIDTPGFQHAGNYVGRKIKPAPPVYSPQRVAQTIVSLVKRPKPATTVGGAATAFRLLYALLPGLTRRLSTTLVEKYFEQAQAVPVSDGSLFHPTTIGTGESGGWGSTKGKRTTVLAGALLVAGVATGMYLAQRRKA